MLNIMICGYGDIGARVARSWIARDARVSVLCRREPGVKTVQDNKLPMQWLPWDLDHTQAEKSLAAADIVYYFAPPPHTGDKDTRIAPFLSSLAPPKKLVLISTSAVYGDCGGAWVTETAETKPHSARGKRRLDAEQISSDWCDRYGVTAVILRVPGIYGPGRLPIERIKKGLPVLQTEIAPYTNRIHCDDLAQVCVEVVIQDVAGIFNVCDGEPGNMSQYFFAVADACGLPRPPEVDMAQAQRQLSAGMLSYLSESRRLDNRKLLKQTAYRMLYPNLAAGLVACLPQ